MARPNDKTRVIIGIALLAFGATHGITGLLANIGWYDLIGVEFNAWYMHPAYQSMCWLAIGVAVSILIPMWLRAIRRDPQKYGIKSVNPSGG